MENRIDAVICGPYPYGNQELSIGIATVLRDLKSGFDKYVSGVSLTVLSGNPGTRKAIETYGQITYLKQPRYKLGSVYLSMYPPRIRRVLRQSDFHVLNVHTSDFGWYGLSKRERLIYTLHGVHWEEGKYIESYKKPFWNLLYTRRQRKLLREVRFLISITPHFNDIWENMTSATVFEIPNPVNDAYFHLRNNRQPGRMLYLGRISRTKNLLTLIKALGLVSEETRDFKLIVAGESTDKAYSREIMQFIHKKNLQDRIEFKGVIGDAQRYDELSKMSFLVLPSFQETAPCTIVESFAASKPVIASNIGGIPYMMNDERNGLLIEPDNESDLADKIIYFVQNPREAEFMGKDAREYAKKNHNLKMVVRLYEKAFENVYECL